MIGDLEKEDFISLYFHIPFCSKKCPYCHFYVQKTQHTVTEKFISSLKQEVLQNLDHLKDRIIYSIYIGGGTPSQLSVDQIEDLLSFLFQLPLLFHEECEITMEANPEDLSKIYLKELSSLKINRLSIGVQSLDDKLLKILKRAHSANQAITSIETAYEVGFNNISIDLMYELPFQTLSSFETTLKKLQTLPISHLSLYNLTFEPGTVFFRKKKLLSQHLPKDFEAKTMLDLAVSYLTAAKLTRYEISAFCKNNLYSRHNTGYWLGRDFLGFGPSAFSYFQKKRFQNISHLRQYIDAIHNRQSPIDFEEKLDNISHIKELVAIHLRLFEGCNLEKFQESFFLKEIIQELLQKEYIQQKGSLIQLTSKGALFYDDVGLYFV